MDQENPNLIPPPSIGASPESRPTPIVRKSGGGSKLWLLVLACVVVGISLGVLVYQQSVAPEEEATPRPRASVIPVASPAVPEVSEVTPSSNSVTYPKVGKVRIYYVALGGGPLRLYTEINGAGGSTTVEMPATQPTATLLFQDTGMTVAAGEALTFNVAFDVAMQQKLNGFAPTRANQCGENGFGQVDVASYVSAATAQVGGEPLVSIQCWGDNTPGEFDFNDFLMIWTYTPATAASSSPAASASVSPSPSPSSSALASPSPSPSKTPTPSPSPSKTPTPSSSPLSGGSAKPSPSASPRVSMPEGSALPEAGVFEVTVGTAGVGIVLLILGLLGLLLL